MSIINIRRIYLFKVIRIMHNIPFDNRVRARLRMVVFTGGSITNDFTSTCEIKSLSTLY